MGDNTILEFGEHVFNSRLTNDNVRLNSISLRFCNTDYSILGKNVNPDIIVDMTYHNEYRNCSLSINSRVKILNPDIYSNVSDKSNKDIFVTVIYGFVASDKFGNKYLYGVGDVDSELLDKFESMVSDTIITSYGYLGIAKVGFEYRYIMSELLSRSEYNYRISHRVYR